MLDKNLNMVKDLDDDIAVHHVLIPYAIYKKNYALINQIGAKIMLDKLIINAPNIAMLILNDIVSGGEIDLSTAKTSDIDALNGEDYDKPYIKKCLAFVSELKRLTNVIIPQSGSYEHIPLADALAQGLITEQKFDEVMSSVVFFTVTSFGELGLNQERLMNAYNSRSTALNCMDFIATLQT